MVQKYFYFTTEFNFRLNLFEAERSIKKREEPAQIIVGDYRFTRNSVLGKGNFGTVYSGYNRIVNQFEF